MIGLALARLTFLPDLSKDLSRPAQNRRVGRVVTKASSGVVEVVESHRTSHFVCCFENEDRVVVVVVSFVSRIVATS